MAKQKNEIILELCDMLRTSSRYNSRFRFACILILILCSSVIINASCPSTASSSTATNYVSNIFSGYTSCQGSMAVMGPVSMNSYLFSQISSGSATAAVLRLDLSNNPVWKFGFNMITYQKNLRIDPNEQNLYIMTGGATIDVVRLSTSDGSIVGQYAFSNMMMMTYSFTINIPTDNSGFYFIGHLMVEGLKLCRYTYSTSTGECQSIVTINSNLSFKMVSLNQFVIYGFDPTSKNVLFYKLTFSSTSVDWADKIVCGSTMCAFGISEMVLSSDASTIYSFLSYGNGPTPYLYFVAFSTSTGSSIGSRYKSSDSVTQVYNCALSGDYMICTTAFFMVLYKTSTSTFQTRNYPNYYYGISSNLISGEFLLNGYDASNVCSMVKFVPQIFNDLTGFSATSTTMSIVSDGAAALVSDSGYTLTAAASVTVVTATYTPISITYSQTASTTSDIYYQTADQSISVIESITTTNSPSLSCSSSGSTTITYSIGNYGSSTAPSWVSIDSSTGVLSMTTPSVNANTEYDFYIISAFSGSGGPVQKLIKLTVLNCAVTNCLTCSSSSGSTCQVCNSGFTLSSGTCTASQSGTSSGSTSSGTSSSGSTSEDAKGLGYLILALIIATLFVVAALSFKNKTSMWSFWSMVGQMQMLILIFVTRSVTSEDIRKLLSTSNFTMNIYHYIYIPNIWFYDWIFSNVKFALTRPSLNEVVLDSDGSIYNLYPVMTCILVLGLLHLVMLFVGKQIMKINSNGKCASLIKTVKWILSKLYRIMTLGFYIRNAFLMCEFVMICSIYEIFQNNGYGAYHVVSLVFAYIMMLLYAAFTIWVFFLSISSYNEKNQINSKLIEFFWGIKESKANRLYMVAFTIRRAVYTIFFVGLTCLSSKVVFGIITAFQFFYLGYILIIRPFKEIIVNAIEVLNESTLLLLLFILNFFPQDGNWTSAQTRVYKAFIVLNFLLIFLFVCANAVYTFIKWVREKPSKADLESEDGPNFVPNEEFPDQAFKKRGAQTDAPMQDNFFNINQNQDVERSRMNHKNNMC